LKRHITFNTSNCGSPKTISWYLCCCFWLCEWCMSIMASFSISLSHWWKLVYY
jgi:hypothetical protein